MHFCGEKLMISHQSQPQRWLSCGGGSLQANCSTRLKVLQSIEIIYEFRSRVGQWDRMQHGPRQRNEGNTKEPIRIPNWTRELVSSTNDSLNKQLEFKTNADKSEHQHFASSPPPTVTAAACPPKSSLAFRDHWILRINYPRNKSILIIKNVNCRTTYI